MFESALIEHKLAKEEYDREEPALRAKLLGAQLKLLEQKDFSVVIVVTGMDGAGKGEVIHRLMEWLDPRHVRVAAYGPPDDAEQSRPRMWRYWRDLPPPRRHLRGLRLLVQRSVARPAGRRERQRPVRARTRRHQPVRGDAGRRGDGAVQVSARRLGRGAETPTQGVEQKVPRCQPCARGMGERQGETAGGAHRRGAGAPHQHGPRTLDRAGVRRPRLPRPVVRTAGPRWPGAAAGQARA